MRQKVHKEAEFDRFAPEWQSIADSLNMILRTHVPPQDVADRLGHMIDLIVGNLAAEEANRRFRRKRC